jgi:hypothetical protein
MRTSSRRLALIGVFLLRVVVGVPLDAQAAPRPLPSAGGATDTVSASCPRSAETTEACALERLALRVQARRAPTTRLIAYTAGEYRDSSGAVRVPAKIWVRSDSQQYWAYAALTTGGATTTANATSGAPTPSSTSTATVPRVATPGMITTSGDSSGARAPTLAARASKPAKPVPMQLVVRAVQQNIPVVIARDVPVPIRLQSVLLRANGDSQPAVPTRLRCEAVRTRGLDVVQTKISPDGESTCWVRLTDDVDTLRTPTVDARVTMPGYKDAHVTITLRAIPVPRYAVRATTPECRPIADRIVRHLRRRGLPQVSYERATRRVTLDACDAISKLLPLRPSDAAANGWYVRGTIDEVGVAIYEQPERVGPFEVMVTAPGTEPMMEAAREVIDRLLKYRAL